MQQHSSKPQEPKIIVIDLFCGAGGTTSGFENVPGVEVIACVNHDENAIMSHAANHPDAEHFLEDITEMYGMVRNGILFMSPQLKRMMRLVDLYRAFYPDVILIIWASLECTNFSKAKGGASRDADSRTLANHMDRYYAPLQPEYLMFENVVEFMSWGPLTARVQKLKKEEGGYKYCEVIYTPVYASDLPMDAEYDEDPNRETEKVQTGWRVSFDAVPNTAKNGTDFLRWNKHILSFGYHDGGGRAWKELNSADFGAYTSRNRLFGCFAKPGYPIVWPEATHEKIKLTKGKKKRPTAQAPSLFTTHINKAPWKPVKEVLDFSDEGKSIFDRKKPLADKTLERIYAGLIKFVAGGKDNFLAKIYAVASNSDGVYDTDSTAHCITTRDAHTLVQTSFMIQHNGGNPNGFVFGTENPARTLTCTGGNQGLVSVFMQKYHGTGDNVHSVDTAGPTIATKDQIGLMTLNYLMGYNTALSVGDTPFIMRDFTNGGNLGSVDTSCGSILPSPKLNLVQTKTPFIMPTNYSNGPTSMDEPLTAITANRKWHYIVNPSHGGHSTGVDVPGPVVVARQDKAPLSVTSVDQVDENAAQKTPALFTISMEVNPEDMPMVMPVVDSQGYIVGIAVRMDESDSPIMRKIKEFMVLYMISDIKMRMLKIVELLKIQGFKEHYVLIGSQADQKKFIGNAVHPLVPEHMAKALLTKLGEPSPNLKMAA